MTLENPLYREFARRREVLELENSEYSVNHDAYCTQLDALMQHVQTRSATDVWLVAYAFLFSVYRFLICAEFS